MVRVLKRVIAWDFSERPYCILVNFPSFFVHCGSVFVQIVLGFFPIFSAYIGRRTFTAFLFCPGISPPWMVEFNSLAFSMW